MPSSGRGVIYTAIREQFVDEARISAQSVRRFLPEARIVLFTDLQLARTEPFDQVIRLTSLSAKPHLDKLHCMKNSPFAETLFLDTDTYVCGELSELFELLAQFDIAMTLDRRYYDDFPPDVGVPGSFCEFNQGVVAFRSSERMQAMLQAALEWAERIRSGRAFRPAIRSRSVWHSIPAACGSHPCRWNIIAGSTATAISTARSASCTPASRECGTPHEPRAHRPQAQ